MILLKIYLFTGLVLHKLTWEILRKRSCETPKQSPSAKLSSVKAVKILVLLGILVQVWLPDILPIANETTTIRSIGTTIFTIGLGMAIAARLQLGDNWANIETGQVLDRQEVVASGIYTYVRHPIYIGDILLLLGLELALNSWLVLGVFVLAPIVLLKAMAEEKMLVEKLPGYGEYCERSKRFIPFVF